MREGREGRCAAGAYQPFLKKRVHEIAAAVADGGALAAAARQEGVREEEAARQDTMRPRIEHVVRQLSMHCHAAHPDCRRWARICAELQADNEALELLCDAAEHSADVHGLLRTTLAWVLTECNRHGAPVLPLPA